MERRLSTRVASALDERIIRGELGEESLGLLSAITLLDEVDSTNLALQRLPPSSQHGHVIIAGQQSAGRGRRGKAWHSPSGCNIYLSIGWRFNDSTALTRLPLAVAVAVVRALRRAGVRECGIKWPNDILVDGRKLAGILVEVQRAGGGSVLAVVGIGINIGMPEDADARNSINQAWTDLSAHLAEPMTPCLRSRTGGLLIDELLPAMQHYADDGFQFFAADWTELDLLRGREIRLDTGKGSIEGVAVGISEGGGLLLARKTPSGAASVQEFVAGEVSVRFAETAAS